MTLGIEAALDAADARGELEGVEDELFRFGRIVGGDRELARILSDRKAPAEGRPSLLDSLLSGKANPVTVQLVRNVLTGPHAAAPRTRSSGSPRWPAVVAASRSPG